MIPRDVDYSFDGIRMSGLLFDGRPGAATVVLLHDAFGLGGFSLDAAGRYAAEGFTVFAADVWGDRRLPRDESEVGALIGSMVADRAAWLGRVGAAVDAARAQDAVDPERLALVGYCFGGSSALEYVRAGGRARAVAAIHPGLDLLDPDSSWVPSPGVEVLVCTGADDPMATPTQRERLQSALSAASADWLVELYSGTTHAFTNPRLARSPHPELFAYHPRSARRAWESTLRFLHDTFPTPADAEDGVTADAKEER